MMQKGVYVLTYSGIMSILSTAYSHMVQKITNDDKNKQRWRQGDVANAVSC